MTPPSAVDSELRYWESPEYREKYSDKDRAELAKKGIGYAMPDGSYPTDDKEDVEKAVKAVGRGGSDHDAIRKHIIAAAKRLGCEDLIPDDWNPDGSLKESNSVTVATSTEFAGSGWAARSTKKRHRHVITPLPEVRFYRAGIVEFRQDTATGEVTITGCPIMYNTPYLVRDMLGAFTERMNPSVGADVSRFDVRLLENHSGLPYARTQPGGGKQPTMRLVHDPATGLRMVATLDGNAQRVKDLLSALERGDVSEMSCGFIVRKDQWNDDFTEREIFQFEELLDVSIVTYPASPTTSVEVARAQGMLRSVRAGKTLSDANLEHAKEAAKSIHGLLKSAGFDPASLLEPDSDDSQDEDGSEGSSGEGVGNAGGLENPDGSGVYRENDPGTDPLIVRRALADEARSSYNDQMRNAESALDARYGDNDGDLDLWVVDMSDNWIVFRSYVSPPGMGLWQISYTQGGDAIMLDSQPTAVVSRTVYEPAPAKRDASRARENRERSASMSVLREARELI